MPYRKVLELGDLPVGASAEVDVDGTPICVVRTAEAEVRAIHDVCSHEEYPLHEGWVDTDTPPTIECALHGSTFDLDTGEPETLPAATAVPVYAARVHDGAIEVDAGQRLNDAPVPRH